MTINHGIQLTSYVGVDQSATKTVVAIVGLAATGTDNKLELIKSRTQATDTFGAATATAKMVNDISILQRYGVGSIVAIKVAEGADAAATEANIVAGLALVKNAYAELGVNVDVIITPGYPTNAVIAAGVTAAKDNGAIYLTSFAPGTTVTEAITARGAGTTGLGTKDEHLVVLFPALKQEADPTVIELYDAHYAGVIARTTETYNYGYSPSNQPLLGISAPELSMSLSYTEETADSEKLNDVGVVTVNRQSTGFVTWGNRNSKYNSDTANDLFSYINVIRVRNQGLRILDERAIKFLGKPSNIAMGRLLEESFRKALSEEAALSPYSTATLDTTESDFTIGKLVYDINLVVYVPVEFISIGTAITFHKEVQL